MATQASAAKAKSERDASAEDLQAQLEQWREHMSKLVSTVTALGKDKAGAAKEKVSAQTEEAIDAVSVQASKIESDVTGLVR